MTLAARWLSTYSSTLQAAGVDHIPLSIQRGNRQWRLSGFIRQPTKYPGLWGLWLYFVMTFICLWRWAFVTCGWWRCVGVFLCDLGWIWWMIVDICPGNWRLVLLVEFNLRFFSPKWKFSTRETLRGKIWCIHGLCFLPDEDLKQTNWVLWYFSLC